MHSTAFVFSREQLTDLPSPVARYFEFALTPGQPLVRRARLTQRGEFASRPGRWKPFSAIEQFEVWPPGFVWDAKIRVAPLLSVRVRDSYRHGEGAMHGVMAGIVTVVDQHGTPEMAYGSLLRYLAECAWLPTALLPAAAVRWDPIDDTTARATLTDSGVTASMDVQFGPRGEISAITALRHRDVKGIPLLAGWRGEFREYERVRGMMVPGYGEVGWMMPDGWTPYWRGRNVRSEFEFVTAAPTVAS